MAFTPKQSDMDWLRTLLTAMKDGAIWMTSDASYKVHKQKKVLEVIDFISAAEVSRVAKVAGNIGWRVITF